MAERIAVITGATGGIGSQVCKYLADSGYTLFAAYRSEAKKEALLASLPSNRAANIHFFPLDLCSLSSVDNFCNNIKSALGSNKIALLINNAGVIADKLHITPDGYESTMQVNYISIKRVTENLIGHIDGRVINTVSCTIHIARLSRALKSASGGFIPTLHPKKQSAFTSLERYSDSKLMLALYTISLAKRVMESRNSLMQESASKIEIFGADPGIVDTNIITLHRWYDPIANIVFRPFIKSAKKGAIPIINAIEYCKEPQVSPLLFANNNIKHFPKHITRKYGRVPGNRL